MKTYKLLWLLLLLVLPLHLWAAPPQPANTVTVLDTNVIPINGMVRIAIGSEFGDQIYANLTSSDSETARKGLKLYLNGVAMEGLKPPTVSYPEGNTATDGVKVVLQFTLERNSNDQANREAWDAFFNSVKYGPAPVQVGIALNNGLIHRSAPGALKFETRPLSVLAAVSVIGLILFLLLLSWAIGNGSMLRANGPGTPYSLGKTQMAFWGLLVAICFLGIWIVNLRMERIPPQVLILIGISGVTGLSSLVIGGNRKNANTEAVEKLTASVAAALAEKDKLQAQQRVLEAEKQALNPALLDSKKSVELANLPALIASAEKIVQEEKDKLAALEKKLEQDTVSEKWFLDIISDENGLSFHRFQAVLWTVILGIVFVVSVVSTFSMPEFENTLLILMGISNGTYLGFKTQENKADSTVK